MEAIGAHEVEAVTPANMSLSTWINLENSDPIYLVRGMYLLPKSATA
jgi:hypothetical protein